MYTPNNTGEKIHEAKTDKAGSYNLKLARNSKIPLLKCTMLASL